MIRFLVIALAAYGFYVLFFQRNRRVDSKKENNGASKQDYTDYEEIK